MSGSIFYGKVPERHVGLPELPYAGVGHGLERVALLRASNIPELSFWVICSATVLGGSELAFWSELRYIPYSVIEKMVSCEFAPDHGVEMNKVKRS